MLVYFFIYLQSKLSKSKNVLFLIILILKFLIILIKRIR